MHRVEMFKKDLEFQLASPPTQTPDNHVVYEINESDGHRVELTMPEGAPRLTWKTTLIPPLTIEFGEHAPDETPMDHLRSLYLREVLEASFPDRWEYKRRYHEQFYGCPRLKYEQGEDSFSLVLELPNLEKVTAQRLLYELREFREQLELSDDEIIDHIFEIIDRHERENRKATKAYEMLRTYKTKLMEIGDNETARLLQERLFERERPAILESVARDYPGHFKGENRITVLIHEVEDHSNDMTTAMRALEELVESPHRPDDWISFLAKTVQRRRPLSHIAYRALLHEAPHSREAIDATSHIIDTSWSDSRPSFVGEKKLLARDANAQETLESHLEQLLHEKCSSAQLIRRVIAALEFGCPPERYSDAFERIARTVTGEMQGSTRGMVELLIARIDNQHYKKAEFTPLFEPLLDIAIGKADIDIRIAAFELLSTGQLGASHTTLSTCKKVLAHCGQFDGKLYKACVEKIVGLYHSGVRDLELLESIIKAGRVDSSVELALETYPRESVEHYSFLLSVSSPPLWLENLLPKELATFEDFDALTPGLEHFFRTCSRESYLSKMMELTARRNIEPFGGHYLALSRFDGFSEEFRERALELREQWNNRNAHLVGGLSLDESPGTGQLTMAQGGRGGLSVHEAGNPSSD